MKRFFKSRLIVRKSIITAAVIAYTIYVYASSNGITGRTLKNGTGCTCHGPLSTNVSVIISGPDTLLPSQTATFSLSIAGGPAAAAGTNIAAFHGVLTPVSSTLQKIGAELTHLAPVLFESDTVKFTFSYTAPDTDEVDTLYGNGNSVDNTGTQFNDQWNFAPKKLIVVYTPPPPTTTTVFDTLRASWNLVSLPVGVANRFKDSVFAHSVSSAFGYNGSYFTLDSLSAGPGYWLKFDSARVIALTGTPISAETIDVPESWNLIGSLSIATPVVSVVTDPPGLLSSSVYGYEGSYALANEIQPGKGYWAKMSSAGKIIISSSSAAPKLTNGVAADLERMSSFTLTDRTGHQQQLYVGLGEDVRKPLNFFELPPVPPHGGFDARFASQRMLEVVQNSETKDFPIAVSSAEYPLTVTWKSVNRTLNVLLMNNGSPTELTPEGCAVITEPTTSLTLKVSSGRAVSTGFALHSGYPNPFNPSTSFNYDLPQASLVSVKVYDLLGKEVRALVVAEQTSGTYTIRWDGTSSDGLASASGIYFVKMSAVTVDGVRRVFTATQKIMLLR